MKMEGNKTLLFFGGEKRKMKVVFRLENVESILSIFKKYRELNWDDEVRFGEAYSEFGDERILRLCTGNQWIVNVSEQTLTYEGSRAGFVALTPFNNLDTEACAHIYNDERGKGIEISAPKAVTGGEGVHQRATLCQYETSHPELTDWRYFSAVLEPLGEDRGKAVVMNPGPKRIVSYKRGINEGE
jgi:hypothetical protein